MNNTSAISPSRVTASGKALTTSLWVAQTILALVFLMSGGMKVAASTEALRAQMPWVNGALGSAVRMIGFVEILGAIGIVLPAATRIAPKLTPVASLGLALVMALASITHLSRGELSMVPVTMTLGGLAVFVAWGRFGRAAVPPRARS
ncbi:DoxX family protein [Geothrix limicola]|uniref:DoxX family protein n=1 Tax=Geothrix limicola TaxID=2927978 RepID=UPI003B75C93F